MADEENYQFAQDPELERAKAWWKEHGRAIVAGIAIGLSAVVGFNFWQNYKQTQAETASVLFEELRGAIYIVNDDEGEDEDEEEGAGETEAETETESETEDEAAAKAEAERAIRALADQLMADYTGTPYATHAAFALAKHAVESGDFGEAERVLRWALDNGDDANLRHIARLRLVSVLLAGEDADAALALLNVPDQAGFSARYTELIGDAYLMKNDPTSARGAYERSVELLPQQSAERALLQFKLDDLGL